MTIIGEKIYLTADSSLPECILETRRGITANDCGSLTDTGRVDLSRIKTLTEKPEAIVEGQIRERHEEQDIVEKN